MNRTVEDDNMISIYSIYFEHENLILIQNYYLAVNAGVGDKIVVKSQPQLPKYASKPMPIGNFIFKRFLKDFDLNLYIK